MFISVYILCNIEFVLLYEFVDSQGCGETVLCLFE